MLVELAYWLQQHFAGFEFLRVVQYLTFRAVMAALTALIIGLWIAPRAIDQLISLKVGQPIRKYGMQTHISKHGTPTMGGVIILAAIMIATLLWFDLRNRFVWLVLFVTLGHGILGWLDDWIKVVNKNPEGMRSRTKFFWQSLIALVAAFVLVFAVAAQSNTEMLELMYGWLASGFRQELPMQTHLLVPFFKQISYPLGVAGFVILTYLVIVGASNAVNLTDGLDGLAIMPVVVVGVCLGIFTYVTGNAVFSKYLNFPFIKDTGEVLIFCTALFGAGLAFLWYNAHPAQIFMGDVGSLALGAALGTVAVVVRQELVFFIMSGVFVAEATSVMVQVCWFKLSKKIYGKGQRVFLMAPLHHHFEKKGWKETQVVVRFWIVTLLLCLLALTTLKLR